jgi:hypothetical protein
MGITLIKENNWKQRPRMVYMVSAPSPDCAGFFVSGKGINAPKDKN